MKRKAKLYGPVLLAALLCALVFATGALKKPKIFENITTDYMVFQKKLPRYSLTDGDEYGVIPMERRGWMHLPAGEYRLRWTIRRRQHPAADEHERRDDHAQRIYDSRGRR